MPKMLQYTSEFKDQAVRFVFESIEANESRKQACERLAPKVNVKAVTLYNWVKAASPVTAHGTSRAGQSATVDELRAQVLALRRENRELSRANDILKAASAFFGAELDRQSRR
jgi:transposase